MSEDAHTRTMQLIAELWRKNQPQILERVAMLDAASVAAESGTLTDAERTEAESMSHKLAGTLGMFGFPAGTDVARALEDEFHLESPNPAVLKKLAADLRAVLFPATDS